MTTGSSLGCPLPGIKCSTLWVSTTLCSAFIASWVGKLRGNFSWHWSFNASWEWEFLGEASAKEFSSKCNWGCRGNTILTWLASWHTSTLGVFNTSCHSVLLTMAATSYNHPESGDCFDFHTSSWWEACKVPSLSTTSIIMGVLVNKSWMTIGTESLMSACISSSRHSKSKHLGHTLDWSKPPMLSATAIISVVGINKVRTAISRWEVDITIGFSTSTRNGICVSCTSYFSKVPSLSARSIISPVQVNQCLRVGTQVCRGTWSFAASNLQSWLEAIWEIGQFSNVSNIDSWLIIPLESSEGYSDDGCCWCQEESPLALFGGLIVILNHKYL